MGIADNYAEQVRNQTRLQANWEPHIPREIGDFGPVRNGLFDYYGQLDPDEIQALGQRSSAASADVDFMVQANRGLNAKAGAAAQAGVATGKALLEINFTSANGISFTALEVTIHQVTNLRALGKALNKRRRENNWDMDHCVVVQINRAAKATIILSEEKNAQLGFEVAANAPVNQQLIGNLDAKTSLLSFRGIGYKIIGDGPITPLFRLACLKRKWWRSDTEVKYRSAMPEEDGASIVEIDDDEHVFVVD
jgi:hypothetical protein